VNAILLITNVAVVLRLFFNVLKQSNPAASPSRFHVALLVAVVFLYYPTVQGYEIGQIQIWINLLVSLACLCWLGERTAWAGALVGLAATIKPQFGLFLLWGVLWREWKFVRGFAATVVPLVLLSLALFGLRNHLSYLTVLSFISQHGEAYFPNSSINGLLNRLLFNGNNLVFQLHEFPPFHPVVATITYLSALVFLLIRQPERPTLSDFSIAVLCATLASPIAWEHHYGVMLPLFAIALAKLTACPERYSPRALWALGAAWVLAANNLAFLNALSGSVLNVLQSYLLFAGLTLLGVLLHIRRRENASAPAGSPAALSSPV
jgi:hypothetical protein